MEAKTSVLNKENISLLAAGSFVVTAVYYITALIISLAFRAMVGE